MGRFGRPRLPLTAASVDKKGAGEQGFRLVRRRLAFRSSGHLIQNRTSGSAAPERTADGQLPTRGRRKRLAGKASGFENRRIGHERPMWAQTSHRHEPRQASSIRSQATFQIERQASNFAR